MSDRRDSGISPVVAIILLVAATVMLVVLASTLAFNIGDDNPSETADVSVTLEQDGNEVQALVVKNSNAETVRIKGPNGSQKNLSDVGDFVSIQDGNGKYTAIAVTESGTEQVVTTTDTETGATIADADSGGQVVNGVVRVNPVIPGATVKAVNNAGTVVNSTTTDANGEYSISVSDIEKTKITATVDGFTFEQRELHATATVPADAANTSIDYDETKRANTSVGGSVVSVIYQGNGTDTNPYHVGSIEELQAINESLSSDYVLTNDINAENTTQSNLNAQLTKTGRLLQGDTIDYGDVQIVSISKVEDESGADVTDEYEIASTSTIRRTSDNPRFQEPSATVTVAEPTIRGYDPIGSKGAKFTGSVDGQGHSIDGLFIERSLEQRVGLFREVGSSGEVKDVTLTNVNVTGNKRVGGLVGNNSGTVSESFVSGSVDGVNANQDEGEGEVVGGLVGFNGGTVSNASANASVTVSEFDAGGLVGKNGDIGVSGGTVKKSFANGTVTGGAGIGGLVGDNDGDGLVSNSSSSGTVSGTSDLGGLVGLNDNTVSNVSSSTVVTASPGANDVGGLVGQNQADVSDGFSSGSVTGGDFRVAGLVGSNAFDPPLPDLYWLDTDTTDDADVKVETADYCCSSSVETGAASGGDFTLIQAKGKTASGVMDGLDFQNTWETVDGEFPQLRALDN